jgi:hypothetical protein
MRRGGKWRAAATYVPAAVVVIAGGASAQDRPDAPVGLRCETYCSSEKLRTANARLTWIGPGVPMGPAPLALPGGQEAQQLLETTVIKNGFERELYASFPTTEAAMGAAPALAENTAERSGGTLRAYDLQLMGVVRPQIVGQPSPEALAAAPERQETTVEVEGLEPGMRYTWRVRLQTPEGWRESEPAVCIAPACPADLREEQ